VACGGTYAAYAAKTGEVLQAKSSENDSRFPIGIHFIEVSQTIYTHLILSGSSSNRYISV
jgi:hypothetical protein